MGVEIVEYSDVYADQVLDLIDLCELMPLAKENLEVKFGNILSFVALDNNKLVGYAMGVFGGDYGYLNKIAMHPDYRRKGIANDLMKKVEAFFKENNVAQIFIPAHDHLPVAKDFYKSIGYDETLLRIMGKELYNIYEVKR